MSNPVENLPIKGQHQPSAEAPSGGVNGAELLERNLKACSIVLKGVDERVDDVGIRKLFRGGGGLPPLAKKVLETRRLGRLRNGRRPATQRHRPVLVRFADSGARDDAFKFSDRLKPYRMEEYLTRSGASPGSPRIGLWDKLPQELQMEILKSPALSMTDLARVGTTAKIFQEAREARTDVDNLWLGAAAVSMFREALVTFIATWVSHPTSSSEVEKPLEQRVLRFDLTKGEVLPDPKDCLEVIEVEVTAPAQGFRVGGPQETAVTWHLHNNWTCGEVKLHDEKDMLLLDLEAVRVGWFHSDILMQSTAQTVAYLGLLHLITLESQKSKACYRGNHCPDLRLDIVGGPRSIVSERGRRFAHEDRRPSWTEVTGVHKDVQRGLAYLHFENRRTLLADFHLTLRFRGTVMDADKRFKQSRPKFHYTYTY
eukprot:jgi/Botrbrau1/16358/Bobra.178_1s0011.1